MSENQSGYDRVTGGSGADYFSLQSNSFMHYLGNGEYVNNFINSNFKLDQALNSIEFIVENQLLEYAGIIETDIINPAFSQIEGTDGNDWLEGTEDADDIFGLEGDDTLLKLDGDDSLIGNAGDDSLLRLKVQEETSR